MLDQIATGRSWETAALDPPLGRGMNLEIQVPNLDAVLELLAEANWPLFMEPEVQWYRTGDDEVGVRQSLVQDPDGYLLRPQSVVGTRPSEWAARDEI